MKNAPKGPKPSGGRRTLQGQPRFWPRRSVGARFQRARLNDWIDFNGNRARWKRAPTERRGQKRVNLEESGGRRMVLALRAHFS